ncbi:MAG: leucine-rich repeat protein [Ruminococcus sp.]|nr:leucine-rich repeat protein [Ruminococcus sp.]
MKKTIKRTFSMVLAFAMLISFVPFGTFTVWAETETSGKCGTNLSWNYDESTATLSIACSSSWGSLDGYQFGETPWFAFRESIKIVNVDIEVTRVGTNAFRGCESLETVNMPGVSNIGDYAFYGCSSLESVELSSCCTSNSTIGKDAFAFCSSLTKIVIPFQYASIEEEAFYYCENLNTLGIYSSANIGDKAFSYCSNLNSIYIINNENPFSGTISNNAFTGVEADVYHHYPYSRSDGSRFGGYFIYKKINSGILGYQAFWNYDQTNEKLTISGEGRLFGFSGGSQLPWMEYNYSSGYSSNIKTIIIEDGITEIPSYSFEYMGNVESVTLPDTLLKLYPNAFNDCKSLTKIVIPASVEYVDGKTYWNRCPNLNDVYYLGTEQEWNEVYTCSETNSEYCITPHFLVYHSATQSCTKAGYPAHYEFDGTANNTFYDLNKVAIPFLEPSKLEHSFNSDWDKDAVSHWHTCTLCKIAVSDKDDHTYDNACDDTCNICEYVRTINHNYSTNYIFNEKSHWRLCHVCGDKTDFGAHVWDDGKVTKEPTCTKDGIKTYTCEICDTTKTEVINATGHTVVNDEYKAPSCTETGLTEGSHCSICGEIIKAQKVISAKGHTEIIDKAKPATCTETGLTEGGHCSVCGEILKAQKVIPATGHTVITDEYKAPTCTETGLTEGSHCSNCGEIIKAQKVIPTLDHKWNDGEITKEPTCTENGIKIYTCEDCDETKTEAIKAKGHSWDEGVVNKEPTYREEGEKLYTCSDCGETKTEMISRLEKRGKFIVSNETVRAGDDIQVKLYIDKNPGIAALSINIAFPEELKLKEVKYTDLLSSKPSNSKDYTSPFTISWLSSDSSDKEGTGLFATLTFTADIDAEVTDYTVRVTYKADNIVDSTLDNIPFDIENGTVTVNKPTPGDVNRDGAINMKDLVLIQQLINNWNVHIVERAADVNDDGDINMKDLVILQQYINGWEVVLK